MHNGYFFGTLSVLEHFTYPPLMGETKCMLSWVHDLCIEPNNFNLKQGKPFLCDQQIDWLVIEDAQAT